MSKGSKVMTVRMSSDLLARIEECIRRRNRLAADAPWTWGDFVRGAVREKIAKMARSRSSRRKEIADV